MSCSIEHSAAQDLALLVPPTVLREHVREWFELDQDSPYMLIVADVLEQRRKPMAVDEQKLFGIEKLNVPRSDVPAVTHVDYSARIQTVHKETNPRYHALIQRFNQPTGCPVIVNTNFNVRGEPIVGTPEDAFRCFIDTNMEVMQSAIVLCARKTMIQTSRKTTSPPRSRLKPSAPSPETLPIQ